MTRDRPKGRPFAVFPIVVLSFMTVRSLCIASLCQKSSTFRDFLAYSPYGTRVFWHHIGTNLQDAPPKDQKKPHELAARIGGSGFRCESCCIARKISRGLNPHLFLVAPLTYMPPPCQR